MDIRIHRAAVAHHVTYVNGDPVEQAEWTNSILPRESMVPSNLIVEWLREEFVAFCGEEHVQMKLRSRIHSIVGVSDKLLLNWGFTFNSPFLCINMQHIDFMSKNVHKYIL